MFSFQENISKCCSLLCGVDMKAMGNNTSCLSLGSPVKFGYIMGHCISGKYTTLIKNYDITN